MSTTRRRPVPREWREDNHRLTTRSHAWDYGWRRVSRTKGYCSCGAKWPVRDHTDNLMYADVLDAWNDHVEQAYHADA